eukprot:TRINITY_DN1081_c0_g1_i1.p1 TRINITY_DN1081_c0_g1~~TRINITY_DN1081_c0_g1_i1.p1  ORF type:complete len:509 (-),score=200.40 TRINITY_DN1081_c0_g1_i1:81-1424(-)
MSASSSSADSTGLSLSHFLESDGVDATLITFSLVNSVGALKNCLDLFAKYDIDLSRIDSKPSPSDRSAYDFNVEAPLGADEDRIKQVVEELKKTCTSVHVIGRSSLARVPWYPQKIADLDKFTHKTLAYGSELAADHPGFTDEAYRRRRLEITAIAANYKHGQEIPRVSYNESEIQTWGQVYTRLRSLYNTHACKQHRHVFPLLERYCGYGPDNIPQLQDVSNFLKECTGWSLRPVSGLLTPRDFLNGLAFRVFHSTQYIRHHSRPFYTPEPDVCHELLGHVPLFSDPEFADFSQEIGIASLGASDEDIEKLASCYWFTVEFGLCNEDDSVKVFGAGLLSSFGELEYSLTDVPVKVPFDPFKAATTKYPITEYQPLYFVAKSFNAAKRQMREFARTLQRPFDVYYNPLTQSIQVLDSPQKIAMLSAQIQSQLALLTHALVSYGDRQK